MVVAVLAFLALGITILAFTANPRNGMLYGMGIPFWLLLGFALYNMTWPAGNTFLAYGSILICLAMTIVMMVVTIIHYIGMLASWNEKRRPISNEVYQQDYKNQIHRLTSRDAIEKRKRDSYWR